MKGEDIKNTPIDTAARGVSSLMKERVKQQLLLRTVLTLCLLIVYKDFRHRRELTSGEVSEEVLEKPLH